MEERVVETKRVIKIKPGDVHSNYNNIILYKARQMLINTPYFTNSNRDIKEIIIDVTECKADSFGMIEINTNLIAINTSLTLKIIQLPKEGDVFDSVVSDILKEGFYIKPESWINNNINYPLCIFLRNIKSIETKEKIILGKGDKIVTKIIQKYTFNTNISFACSLVKKR